MKEYIDVEVLKKQDFQDYSNTDVEYAIDHCPRADVAPRAEVAREIFAEIEKLILRYYNDKWYTVPDLGCDIEMLKQKYEVGSGELALENVVDLDKQTADNNAAMRKVMDFMKGTPNEH